MPCDDASRTALLLPLSQTYCATLTYAATLGGLSRKLRMSATTFMPGEKEHKTPIKTTGAAAAFSLKQGGALAEDTHFFNGGFIIGNDYVRMYEIYVVGRGHGCSEGCGLHSFEVFRGGSESVTRTEARSSVCQSLSSRYRHAPGEHAHLSSASSAGRQ